MTTEEKQLLLKDICERLPYGVKAQVRGWDEAKEKEVYIPLKIYSINTDGYAYFESNDYDVNYNPIENCLLYLRPMSSMTEDEEKEHENCFQSDDTTAATLLVDFYNKHHFDYRGLIEKGLALEAPEGMYKEK